MKSGHTVVEFGQTWVTRMHTINKTKYVTMKCQSYAPYTNITICMYYMHVCHTCGIFCNISSMHVKNINQYSFAFLCTDPLFYGSSDCLYLSNQQLTRGVCNENVETQTTIKWWVLPRRLLIADCWILWDGV